MTELDEKTHRLVAMLEREKFDAVMLTAQHNFAWLTGGASNGVDLSRENGSASLMVTVEGRRFVVANRIEMSRMLTEELPQGDWEPIEFAWQASAADAARTAVASGARFAADLPTESMTVIEHAIAECRHRLTPDEALRYRQLGADAGAAFRSAINDLNPGETEIEIAEKLRHRLALENIVSIVTLVAADERISQFRHPIPTANRWNKTLLLVTCAKRDGLVASLSRVICNGAPSNELERRTEAAAYVNACLLEATRPGAAASGLYETAAKSYAEMGFPDEINLHHQGGAAGYKPREWVAHPNGGQEVQLNQAFAWNPSITGTKVEETGIVTKSGVEIITASPDFPRITTVVDGREYQSPGVLSL